MFKYCSDLRSGKNKYESIFKLVDDDFECDISFLTGHIEVGLVKEYKKRKLDAGRNLALFCIWYVNRYNKYNWDIEEVVSFQNRICAKIKDWEKIKRSRDRWLKKLVIWA